MTHPSISGLEKVLARLGRASTPAVRETKTGMSLSRLLGQNANPENSSFKVFGIVGPDLKNILDLNTVSYKMAIPGHGIHAFSSKYSGLIVIDRQGFNSGPWLGIESEAGKSLREEVYELCRHARTHGIPVWFIDIPLIDTYSIIRIKSSCDVVFPYTALEDFEEGAPTSSIFDIISSVANERFNLENVE